MSRESRLTGAQLEVVTAPPGPMLVVAGAGCGKTTTVTMRILHQVTSGNVHADQVLAVTHSRRAAAELRERLLARGGAQLAGVQARTFHSAAMTFLVENWHLTGLPGRGPVLVDDKFATIRAAAAAAGIRLTVDETRDITDEISWAQARRITHSDYVTEARRARRKPGVDLDRVADVFNLYESHKTAAGTLDFESLLGLAATVAASHQDRVKFRSFVVDEYQDTDPLQQHLLESFLGDGDDICVVGDPRQCIYSFKGAEPRFLLEFKSWWPDAKVVELVDNFRSTPQILEWANRLDNGSLTGGFRTGKLTTPNVDGPDPQVLTFYDEQTETAQVIHTLKAWHAQGVDWDEMAVLFRFNAQSARFEAACSHAGIPVEVEDNGFFEDPSVLSVLRPFGQYARHDRDADGLAVLVAAARATGWDPDAPPPGQGAARQRHEMVTALVELAELIVTAGFGTAGELLDELLERARQAQGTRTGGVALLTLHRSKGLEFDGVVIAGCTEGAVPAAHAVESGHVAEERRLLYVGVTRARKLLHVTWAARRPSPKGDGKMWQARPSRWLTTLNPMFDAESEFRSRTRTRTGTSSGLLQRAGAGSSISVAVPGAGLRGCGGCGERLVGVHQRRLGRCPDCLTGDDLLLAQRVRQWRDQVAARRGVQAKDVLTDAAVIGIIAVRPSTVPELQRIAGTSGVRTDAEDLIAVCVTS